ncbi:unnamed protein product [Caenorhabditis auriculariae]|uniref:CUE domain-containing protein n=1 Tax=Caenorhabditis auriculariae TaxID=2777116 RepID=A0A8S1H6G2_9PELO|nr:unnamed protein product [Caenorhabditis auriculariae]
MNNPAAGDAPSHSNKLKTTFSPPQRQFPIEELFFTRRISSILTRYFICLYFVIGVPVFLVRCFIGAHAFLIACLLRKTTAIRSVVMRIMCLVLGIVVVKRGTREESARVLAANHVSVLDHMAIDLMSPCFFALRLGYPDHRSLVLRQAKELVEAGPMPLLAFPEGVITSGQKALIKFNPWAFEVADRVQPVAVRVWRPALWAVAPAHIASTWWSDVFFFFALPFTVINITFLPSLQKNQEETSEDFAQRVSKEIGDELQLAVCQYDTHDAAEAAKRWRDAREVRRAAAVAASSASTRERAAARISDPKGLDDAAMRIKQSFPAYHVAVIRRDLDKTRSQGVTVANIKAGKLPKDEGHSSGKVSMDASSWKKVYDDRKWNMIETNRAKYLNRLIS